MLFNEMHMIIMSLDEEKKSPFEDLLKSILRAEPGINKVILVDNTGLTIDHVSKFTYSLTLDIDAIGAIASAIYTGAAEQGKGLGIGDLNILISEFGEGKIFISGCGKNAILCVVTENNVNIGMVRMLLKRAGKELAERMEEFQAEKPVIEEMSAEARDIDSLLDELESLEM